MALTRLRCSCSLTRPALPQRPPPSSPSIRFSSSTSSSTSATPQQRPRPPREDPRWPGWTPTIGLELHVQLKGNPKLFSPARGVYDAEPNKHVARFDAALPGSLPILRPPTLRLALLSSLALNCKINNSSTFDRKHYFYPDLPSGWQVTQKYSPLATDGLVRVRLDTNTTSSASKTAKKKNKKGKSKIAEEEEEPEFVDVRIEQVQLEQDTAKSFHDPSLPPSGGTLVDLNRSGTALIEIVTHPDMSTPEEAGAFLRSLQRILRFVGGSAGNMDKGELRCDVNVSVCRREAALRGERGTRCEVKNLNGVKFVMGAIEAEITRQISLLTSSPPVPITQSTLGYSPLTHSTFLLRSKESALDYRYMPDPELGVVRVTEEMLEKLRSEVPELPDEAYERLQRAPYELSKRDAGVIVALGEGETGEGMEEVEVEGEGGGAGGAAAVGVRWFEEVVGALTFGGEGEGAVKERARQAGNWLINDLLGLLSRHSLSLTRSPVSPKEVAELIDAVKGGRITGTNAKQLLREYIAQHAPPSATPSSTLAAASPSPPPSSSSPSSPASLSFSSFLSPHLSPPPSPATASSTATSSSSPSPTSEADTALSSLVSSIISSLPIEADKVRSGQEKVLMRMVGEAMKRSKGKADAKKVLGELRRRLLGEGK